MKIANKKLVNNMKKILLKELEDQFKDNYSNLEIIFKVSIENAIKKLANNINNDIIKYGAFTGSEE
uniref:Uncharacterized protein n=1 Tax=uncultured marine virus TaxID=186617 RepID=A0A0F7L5L7_9VIRU|nr:hypothetical protein [uncultured marine virus]